MATYYVYSGATGAGTGADWTNAYTTIAGAVSGKTTGHTFYIAHDHAETSASTINLSSGLGSTLTYFLCVNRAGSVPPVSADLRTTATVSTTGAANITINVTAAYWYGIQFQAGSSSSTAYINIGGPNNFINCVFKLNNTSASSIIYLQNTTGSFIANGCSFVFGHTGQIIYQYASNSTVGPASIIGGSIAATGTVPTTCFYISSNALELIGVDLSAFGSGKTLFDASATRTRTRIENCKLGSSVTLAAGSTSNYGWEIVFIANDSAANNYRYEKYMQAGTETTETTIVRTGGASNGTTAYARKIVTNSAATWAYPFESEPLVIWNDTSGSAKTITVYGIWGGGAVPNSDDIWMEVRYLGSSLTPISSTATTTKSDILASGSALTSDTSTWGGSTTKFKMSVSVTPQMKGPIQVVIKAAKASSTFYYDPLISVT